MTVPAESLAISTREMNRNSRVLPRMVFVFERRRSESDQRAAVLVTYSPGEIGR